MTDDEARKKIRLSKEQAYWVPGVEGVCMEAALADFVAHRGTAQLTISKTFRDGKLFFSFYLKKDPPVI